MVFHLELEFDYRRKGIDTFEPSGGDGDTMSPAVTRGMVNALYDFQLGCAFTPCQGVGIGWANAAVSAFTP